MNPHPLQLYNIGLKALITSGDKALALYSSPHWELPGGRINENEDPGIAFEREIYEETGITLKDYKYTKKILGYDQRDIYKKWHDGISLFLIVHQVDFEELPEIKLSDEHSEYKWITKDILDSIEFIDGKTKDFYKTVLEK